MKDRQREREGEAEREDEKEWIYPQISQYFPVQMTKPR
jgi:hypothetical protein